MRFSFIGPPGSGKGTQSRLISARYHIVHLSTGDILRNEMRKGTDIGETVKKYVDSGELVPDNKILDIVDLRLECKDCLLGFILDGFPRTLEQAQSLDLRLKDIGCSLDAVIYLNIEPDILKERINGRLIDNETGKEYHEKFNPPPQEIRGRVVKRRDDEIKKFLGRLNIFYKEIDCLLDFYHKKSILYEIDGNDTIENIFKKMVLRIERKTNV